MPEWHRAQLRPTWSIAATNGAFAAFHRDIDEFEQIMGYYWVNTAQDYLQSLGFTGNRAILGDSSLFEFILPLRSITFLKSYYVEMRVPAGGAPMVTVAGELQNCPAQPNSELKRKNRIDCRPGSIPL